MFKRGDLIKVLNELKNLNNMEKQQTAVEWLVEQMIERKFFDKNTPLSYTTLEHLVYKSKEMEKEQSINFGKIVADKWGMIPIPLENIKDIYNETFKTHE